jgi:small subunit ribosomal protein S5
MAQKQNRESDKTSAPGEVSGQGNPAAQQQQTTDGLDSRVVSIRRTTKVVKGGRAFSFSATAVVGDHKGKIGLGRGKAKEVSVAIQKANENARRNMKKIELNGNTLFYDIVSNHGATRVFMKPAAEGTGIIAGGAMRSVFEVLGVQNVLAKIIGSANPDNVIHATIHALENMTSPELIAEKRGKTVAQIFKAEKNHE